MSEGLNLVLDQDELTLGDMEDFEDASGFVLADVFKPVQLRDEDGNKLYDDKGRPQMGVGEFPVKAMIALVWILQRKTNPEFTLAQAREVKITDLKLVESDADVDDPKG